jgi:hypothetical protein
MERFDQEIAASREKGMDVEDGPDLRSELLLLNAVFEAARMGRAGEKFALNIGNMTRLVSRGSWSRERGI